MGECGGRVGIRLDLLRRVEPQLNDVAQDELIEIVLGLEIIVQIGFRQAGALGDQARAGALETHFGEDFLSGAADIRLDPGARTGADTGRAPAIARIDIVVPLAVLTGNGRAHAKMLPRIPRSVVSPGIAPPSSGAFFLS